MAGRMVNNTGSGKGLTQQAEPTASTGANTDGLRQK
jgi:hypothetical protein